MIKKQVSKILNNRSAYPKCIVTRAENIDRLIKKSNAAAVEIRKDYRDIWIAFIKRSKLARDKGRVNNEFRLRFGEERMKAFWSLRSRIRTRNSFMVFVRRELDAEIKLVESNTSDLQEVLKFLEAVNERKAVHSWVRCINPERFAEIMTWKMINETNN